jgi:hypothetical protein
VHVDPLFGFRVDPSVESAPAGKHQSMRTVILDYGKLEIVAERRGGYGLPHLGNMRRRNSWYFDLDHN